jgi:hypothetical protein
MMLKTTKRLLSLMIVCMTAAACGGGGGGSTVANLPATPPLPPAGVALDMTSTVEVNPINNLTANGTTTTLISITVRDINNTGLVGQTVSVNVSGNGNILTPSSGATNALGVFTATLASTTAETKIISAIVNPGLGQIPLSIAPSIAFIPVAAGSPDPNQSTVVANPLAGLNSNGTDTTSITVTVRDTMGAVLANQPINLSSGSGTNFAAATGMTTGAGVFSTTMTATQPGSKTINAVIDMAGLNVLSASRPVVVFSAAPGTPDPSQSSFVASPITGITADGVDVSNLTVTVRDPSGATLANQTVNLSAVGTATALTPSSGTTNASGVFTATLSTTSPGVKAVTAIVNPGVSQVTIDTQPTVSFSPPLVPNKFQSTVEVTPNMGIFASGQAMATITITVKDVNNNVLPGREVMVSATGTGNNIAAMMGTTNGSGVYTTTISSTDAGLKTLTGNIDPSGTPIEIDTKPEITFDVVPPGPDAALSTVVANPTTGLTANGTDLSTITVTVVNAASIPLNAQMVSFSVTGLNNMLSMMTGMTDVNGVFTSTLTTTDAGTKTITATINPGASQVVLTAMPQVTYTP